ncbi:MAG: ion channel [Actinomycetes bacterium]
MADSLEVSASSWRKILFGRDSFFPVLFLAIVTILISPLIGTFRFGFLIVYAICTVLVLLAFHRSRVTKRTLSVVTILLVIVGGISVITSIARLLDVTDDRYLVGISTALFALLIASAFPVVVRRAFQHEQISLNTLAAAITAYLLIGLFFASLYWCDSAFQHYLVFQETTDPSAGDYIYFSFITLTTVGFGDFTPATQMARSLAIFEAILGQVFLVTAVARIVSLLGSQRPAMPRVPTSHDFTQSDET